MWCLPHLFGMAGTPKKKPPARQQAQSAGLRKAGLLVMKTLTDQFSVYQKPVSTKQTKDIPKEVHAFLDRFLKTTDAEVFGSLAMQSYTHASRAPGDLDVVVQNPQYVAQYIANELRRAGHRAVVEQHPWAGGYAVKVARPDGSTVAVADVHDMSRHLVKHEVYGESRLPLRAGGMRIQAPEDQLLRKGNSLFGINSREAFGPEPHRAEKDLQDFLVIARTLLDSKKIQGQADLKKVEQAEKALRYLETHAASVPGVSMAKVRADPIPAKHEQAFIKHAVANPEIDVEDLAFTGEGRIENVRREPKPLRPNRALRTFKEETGGVGGLRLF
jgi:hypothetical protein